MFGLFRKKRKSTFEKTYSFSETFEGFYSYLLENHPKELNVAKEEFINLSGQFDEESENFSNKLDDYRHWASFIYGCENNKFKLLQLVESEDHGVPALSELEKGVFGFFEVLKVQGSKVTLKNLFTQIQYTVDDEIRALSFVEGGWIQTALFETDLNSYQFGVSILYHPKEAKNFIKKKIKNTLKEVKKNKGDLEAEVLKLCQEMTKLRYTLYKYRQLAVSLVYSEKSRAKEVEKK